MAGETAVTDSPRSVKRVTIYKNGDMHSSPKTVVVNTKQYPNYDAFLSRLTEQLKFTTFCERLYTPRNGHKVKGYADIEPNGSYVAAGRERFKRLGYFEIGDQLHKRPVIKADKPIRHARRFADISARFRKVVRDPLTIFVYLNGDDLHPAHRVLLTPRMLSMRDSWEQICREVQFRVSSVKGAIVGLYTVDGQKVHGSGELKNGEHYVAVEYGTHFTALPYGKLKEPLKFSPRHNSGDRKLYNREKPYRTFKAKRYETNGYTYSYESGSNDSSKPNSEPSPSKNRGYDRSPARTRSTPAKNNAQKNENVRKKGGKKKLADEDNGPFHSKPVTHKRSGEKNREVDYDRDGDDIFKRKGQNQETQGAAVVDESKDTQVELPLDQVEAEEVQEDENVNNDQTVRDGNELTKQPSESEGGIARTKKDENQDEENTKAATVIQSRYRGYRGRKIVKREKEKVKAATTIQAHVRGYQTRKKCANKN